MSWTWLRSSQAAYLLAALVLAVLAYVLAHRYLSGQARAVRAEAEAAWVAREVVVAAGELPAGERIAPAALALRTIPERYLPSDALDRAGLAAAVGMRLLRPLRSGEVLTRSAVESATAPSIAALVAEGERAYTLPVDEAASAAGLLAPGDLVDLLFLPQDEGDGAARVLPLMEAVPVIATGHSVRRRNGAEPGAEPEAYGTITLRVRPEQAQRLLLAQRLGQVAVAVRAAGDEAGGSMAPLGREALFGRTFAARDPRPSGRPATVEFIIGGTGSGSASLAPARRGAGARS